MESFKYNLKSFHTIQKTLSLIVVQKLVVFAVRLYPCIEKKIRILTSHNDIDSKDGVICVLFAFVFLFSNCIRYLDHRIEWRMPAVVHTYFMRKQFVFFFSSFCPLATL